MVGGKEEHGERLQFVPPESKALSALFDFKPDLRLVYRRTHGMEWWPANVGKKHTGDRRSSKGRQKARDDSLETAVCPVVEYGSIAGASLSRQGRRLEWTFAVNEGIGELHTVQSPSNFH